MGGVALHGAELNLENTRFPLLFLVIFLPVHYGPTVNKPKAVYYLTDGTPYMFGVWCFCYLTIHVQYILSQLFFMQPL